MDYLKTILEHFPIEIKTTNQIPLDNVTSSTRLYKLIPRKSSLLCDINTDVYLIDTPAGREIACHPHLVSKELSLLCINAAEIFSAIINELRFVTVDSAILHILRGSSGYMVHKALPDLPVINIRTEYSEDGYRKHSDDSRMIQVSYSDYRETEIDTLIIPDTYATGRSAEAVLKHIIEKGFKAETVVIYGFIAVSAIKRLYRLLDGNNIKLTAFSICNITQICSNNYDMPLYGLDEHLYREECEIRPMGSIVSMDTLRDMIPLYVPGMDQPGDWSERHSYLYNGHTYENGNIQKHLEKSIIFMESLDRLNSQQPWYTENIYELTRKEIRKCKEKLSSIRSNDNR